jgi:dienelactone hydrolase
LTSGRPLRVVSVSTKLFYPRRSKNGSRISALIARTIALIIAVVAVAVSVRQLERARAGITMTEMDAGSTPATIYRAATTKSAPAVIIAHGFAGSRRLMEAYALTFARAGYVAVSFDFEGHGDNPRPMSGDVTRIEGTTQKLMAEISRVTDRVLELEYVDGRLAILGHSMAADIIVRQAKRDDRIRAVVAISMFSQAVTPNAPRNLLMISGEWEYFLRQQAVKTLRLSLAGASEGDTVTTPDGRGARRAIMAPSVEHVAVLYSATALDEARRWLDRVFGRQSETPVAATGGWIVLLLAGLVLLAWPMTAFLPRHDMPPPKILLRPYLIAALAPALITPPVATLFDVRLLPVLVADYLALHLLVYGLLSLAILRLYGVTLGRLVWLPGIALACYGIFVFGGAIDRYVTSFMVSLPRLPVVAATAVGAVAYMLADSRLTEAGHAPLWRVLMQRTAFLGSLGLAVWLDPERLFFLLIIVPVIVVFYSVFGLMGGWVGRTTGSPLAEGLGMGLTLAWAIGVTFPLFTAT